MITPASETAEFIDPEGVGGKIDCYRIVSSLGEGGFGEVFEAEQEEPIQRRVALKLIIPGMNTREVIARFGAERQALAMMEHPNIARVFDAGATASGRPYFVMELVAGAAITDYFREQRLTLPERLALFEQLCHAVQHAHTKGVIHRDLKPSNVLVSKTSLKVIDFGLAKAISGRLTAQSLHTEQHRLLGTPMYMSPEQARGSADIDTRTDVYSLGAILYEILTGTAPFALAMPKDATESEVQRTICEIEPERPSARLTSSQETLASAAHDCRIDAKQLRATVRGELDWIVMKALDAERARRYETVDNLAADVRRYLDGHAIAAAPPSRRYRVGKFIRRHSLSVVASLAVAASLVLGAAGFAWQASIAKNRAAELEQVANFQAAMLEQIDPALLGNELTKNVQESLAKNLADRNVSADELAQRTAQFQSLWQSVNATDSARELISKAILEPGVRAIDKQFGGQPLVQARLRLTLAERYLELGLFDRALPLAEKALEVRQALLGNANIETLRAQTTLCNLIASQGKLKEAESHCKIALEILQNSSGATDLDRVDSLTNAAGREYQVGNVTEALPLASKALDMSRRALGDDTATTIGAINLLGSIHHAVGDLGKAEPLFREALERSSRVLGPEHSGTLMAYNNLGTLLDAQGKSAEAEDVYQKSLVLHRKTRGEDNPDTLYAINNLAQVLYSQGKLADAEKYWRFALEKRRQLLGENHPETAMSIGDMAALLLAKEDYPGALALAVEAHTKYIVVLGGEHPLVVNAKAKMSAALRLLGRLDEANVYASAAVALSIRIFDPMHPAVLLSKAELAAVRVAQHRYQEAVQLLAEIADPGREAFAGAKNYRTAMVLQLLGEAQLGLGQFALAETNLKEAHEILTLTPAPAPRNLRECSRSLVKLYTDWNKTEPNQKYSALIAQWQAKVDALENR